MTKVGLVLEGGGMRGAYTAGVCDWLIENGIEFDHVTGVSSGAMYGAVYLTKDRDLLARASIEIAPAKKNVGLRALLSEGQLVAYDSMYDHQIYEAGFDPIKMLDSDSEFSLAVYDMQEYETIWIDKETVAHNGKWIKAACSLPFYSRLVEIDGRDYTDGGVTTMIPVGRSQEVGCEKHLVVTTKSKEYVRKPFSKFTLWFLNTFFYRKQKQVVKDFAKRTDIYYQERKTIDDLVEKQTAVYLYPTEETGVSRFSGTKEQFQHLFEMAHRDCENQREAILNLFK